MIELQDGMLLYHGSYIGIPEIDLDRLKWSTVYNGV